MEIDAPDRRGVADTTGGSTLNDAREGSACTRSGARAYNFRLVLSTPTVEFPVGVPMPTMQRIATDLREDLMNSRFTDGQHDTNV